LLGLTTGRPVRELPTVVREQLTTVAHRRNNATTGARHRHSIEGAKRWPGRPGPVPGDLNDGGPTLLLGHHNGKALHRIWRQLGFRGDCVCHRPGGCRISAAPCANLAECTLAERADGCKFAAKFLPSGNAVITADPIVPIFRTRPVVHSGGQSQGAGANFGGIRRIGANRKSTALLRVGNATMQFRHGKPGHSRYWAEASGLYEIPIFLAHHPSRKLMRQMAGHGCPSGCRHCRH
jgi:hypothetical protein